MTGHAPNPSTCDEVRRVGAASLFELEGKTASYFDAGEGEVILRCEEGSGFVVRRDGKAASPFEVGVRRCHISAREGRLRFQLCTLFLHLCDRFSGGVLCLELVVGVDR